MGKFVMFLVCLVVIRVGPAHALRCGMALVSKGDHKIEVRQKCGEPVSVDQRVVYKVIRVYHTLLPIQREIAVPILVEEWTYNFGPHRFIRQLRFENGTLQQIRVLGYGY